MQHSLPPRSLTAQPLQQSSSDFGHVTLVEGLKVSFNPSVSNLVASFLRLRPAEAILQSITWALTPDRHNKKKTRTLALQAVNVTAQIATLIEATKEAPQWPKHIAHLEEVLHEIRLFTQTETQRSVLRRALTGRLVGKTISIRYTEIEQRLTSVLDDAKQCNTEIPAGISMNGVSVKADPISSAQSQASSNNSMNSANVVRSNVMFSNAQNLMVTGGQYYNGPICIHHSSSQESGQGIVPGLRVRLVSEQVAFEDISISREIYKTPLYRLYSDNGSGKAKVIKVYDGPRAKVRAQETAKFHMRVMHHTVPHIIGVSPLNCAVSFLVFNGSFEGSLEASIAKALEVDLRKSVILGLRTVIGLSSGLNYLRGVAYPFVNAGSQHFCAFLNLDEEVIISFDPDIAYEQSDSKSVNERSSLLEVDKPLLIFHKLCQQTFDAACQAHYEKQQVQRTFADTLESEASEDFIFSGYGDEGLQPEGIASTSATSESSMNVSPKKLLGSLPTDGHRRELVWKSQDEKNSSLEDIYFEFRKFHDRLLPSSEPALHRRRGRYTVRTVHRCPGYNRTEITLTPSITRSAIVSHSTPLPNEICPVCNRVVQDDVEIFDCICGGEDDESKATIQCSKCRKWHHRHCVGSLESTTRCFTCPNDCSRTNSEVESSHVTKHPEILPPVKEAHSSPAELKQTDTGIEAISTYRKSLSLCPTSHPNRSSSLNNLANALQNHHQLTGSMADIDEAISLYRESLSLCSMSHPNRFLSLYNLAIALRNRCRLTGSTTDLEEAISMHRESLSLCPSPHSDRSRSLNSLANALRSRYRQSGLMTDLEEAISMHRESLLLRPSPHPERSISLNNLGVALQIRFSKTSSIADLDEAISILRELLALRPATHSGRLRVMKTLVSALETRFKESGAQSDLSEVTSLHQEALAMYNEVH